MNRPSPRATLIAAFVILGIALAAAYNTLAAADSGASERGEGLAQIVRVMEDERGALEEGLADLRERVARIEERAAEEAGMAESFGRELDEARAAAGLTGVRGSGVVVDLADAESVPAGQDPTSGIIHDFDVRSVVNALFARGAEAVSVNGERVVATTAIRCAGNTILVNSNRLGNPYLIQAVGDPEDLEEGLLADVDVGPLFEAFPAYYGLIAKISREAEVEVPAYRGSLRADHAVALEGGD